MLYYIPYYLLVITYRYTLIMVEIYFNLYNNCAPDQLCLKQIFIIWLISPINLQSNIYNTSSLFLFAFNV